MKHPKPVKRLTHAERADRRERIAEAVRQGADPGQVANEEKVSWNTVYDACRAAGVQTYHRTRTQKSLPPLTREFHAVSIRRAFDILALLRRNDKTSRKIALSVGVKFQWVSQIEQMALEAGLLSPRGDAPD